MELRIHNLSKRFGGHLALDRLELTSTAQVLALVGPSGGGKSTLLRLLAGLEHPDGGEIRIGGEPLDFEEAALARHRRRVAMVFQASNLFPHLNALENVVLPLEHAHGMTRAAAVEMAMGALERFGLADHALKSPFQLSGGQRQRVAICRAVVVRPRLMLLDEPTSALDPEMKAEVLDLIAEQRGAGMDMVLSTHELAFARSVGDEIAFIAGGRVLEAGPASEFFSNPRHEAARSFLSKVLRY